MKKLPPICLARMERANVNPNQKGRQALFSNFKNLLAFGLFAFLLLGVQETLTAQDNIAKFKPAKQSSTLENSPQYGPSYANDGEIQNKGGGKIMCTQREPKPWWEVDLEDNYTITEIKVHNRINCCPDRLDNFSILVSDKPFTGNSGGTVFAENLPMPPGADGIGSYSGNISGRYVRIFLNGNNHLSIPEIEIFGTKTPDSKGTVILHNEGGYDLEVFKGERESGESLGKLLEDARLPLHNMAIGTYLSFKAIGTEDNVRTEPLYLWNVNNQNYFVYSQGTAHALTDAFPIGPNLHGINLTTLDPRDIASGKQGQIFEGMGSTSVDYTSLEGADGRYIKEGFDYTPNHKGKGSDRQKMRYKAESVKNSWSINVDLSGSVPVKGARVDAGVGVGYNEFDETHKNQKEIYLERSEWKTKYSIECDSSRADLTSRFKVAAKALPEVYNVETKKEYKKFVDYYGTHFLSEIVYGGFYNSFVSMSENSFNSLQGNALNVKSDLGISKGGNTETTETTNPVLGSITGKKETAVKTNSNNSQGGKLSISYSKEHEEALTEHFQEMEGGYEYAGGDGSFDDWSLSEYEAVPIIIKPQLISALIRPEVFRDDTDHAKLRKIKSNLEDYLKEYIGNMPKKKPLEAPPVAYKLEINEVMIINYKDDGDATQKADISLMAYSGVLSRLREKEPRVDYRQGDVNKQLVREANINPAQKLNQPLAIISPAIGLVVKRGNPDKRVFKIVGKFKEYDSNFGGTPEEWVASGYLNTDLTDTNPSRNGELRLTHSATRWGSRQQFDVLVKYTLTRNSDIFDVPQGVQVEQSSQAEQIPASELVTDPALNAPITITFRHKGAYIAKYSIEYTANGKRETINTGEVTSVSEGSYDIPADASNVKVKAEGLTGLVWAPVTVHFQQTYPTAVSRIIESHGTTLNQSYKELNESGGIVSQGSSPPPPSNEKRITLRNKGGYVAKYTIHYTLNGQTKTINEDGVLAGQERVHDISADATNVIIQAQGATGLVWEPWSTHFKQTYPKNVARTIESHGTTLNQSYKEFIETGGIVSQGSTPPPPADSKRITLKNRAAYTARYTLSYNLQGKPVEESSGHITTGRDKVYDIPRVATNIKVIAEGGTGLVWEPWRKHFEKTYSTASDITVESRGTTLDQSAIEQ